jgi:hypothetical protein
MKDETIVLGSLPFDNGIQIAFVQFYLELKAATNYNKKATVLWKQQVVAVQK